VHHLGRHGIHAEPQSPAEKELSNFSRLCLTPLAQEIETW
jgi:hypothetical protein